MKKILIIILAGLVIVGVGVGTYWYISHTEKTVTVSSLNYVDLTKTNGESDIVSLVKDNVVKITNKINDDIKIVGSGFFDGDGYLITNSHVVDIKGDISITYQGGTISKAKLVANDIASDIAILSVDDVKAKALQFTETLSLKVADNLYAIGYPLNLEGDATVTKGILSARRSIAGIEYLQTDATIDNGSSGGPLISTSGLVVGMNSLASNTSNINLALSSETIQNILTKLKNKPTINYINNERPQNALSNILREVGYTEIDIYNEWDIINTVYGLHIGYTNDNNNQTTNETNKVLDSDSFAKYISIAGYDGELNFHSGEYSYKFHLQNGEETLQIKVTPNSDKATYKIIGNGNFQLGSNIVTVIITAENGSKTTYTFYVIKPVNELDGIVGIQCGIGKFDNKASIDCSFLDSRGDSLYNSDYPMLVANTITAKLYVKILNDEPGDETINSDNVKYIKTYNFKAKSYTNTAIISESELRTLLNDDYYNDDNMAQLYFIVTINTYKNGSFTTTSSPYSLKK